MNTDLFETNSIYELHSIKLGVEGYLVYSIFDNPEDLIFLSLGVWCFHLNDVKHELEFPIQLDSITLTKMRCNDGYLLVLKSKNLLLKINTSQPPSKFEQLFEFQQGIHLASPVSTDTMLSEFDIALDWLLLSKENSQVPLPGLPAIAVLSDSIVHYLNHFSTKAKGIARLKTLVSRYMDYDLSEAQYVFQLRNLKSAVHR